jgi:hypothetical protein
MPFPFRRENDPVPLFVSSRAQFFRNLLGLRFLTVSWLEARGHELLVWPPVSGSFCQRRQSQIKHVEHDYKVDEQHRHMNRSRSPH